MRIRDPAFEKRHMVTAADTPSAELDALIAALEAGDAELRQQIYGRAMRYGGSFSAICETLIAPAARRLGDCWANDTLSFSAVSSSCSGLHSDMMWLTEQFSAKMLPTNGGVAAHSVAVFAFPGDRHKLGASVLAESFRQAGWNVTVLNALTAEDCIEPIQAHHFDLVVISIARAELLPKAATLLTRLRLESRNRSVKLMIGGPAITESAVAVKLGADATSFTGQEAVFQANILVDEVTDRIPDRV